jgi:hypothetical protein
VASLLMICALFGLDRRNTIELSYPLAPATISFLPLLAGVTHIRWYFTHPPEGAGPLPNWNLKHDSSGCWAAKGVIGVLALTAVATFFVYPSVSMLAQHFATETEVVSATARAVRDVSTPRTICRITIDLQFMDGVENEVCLSVGGFAPSSLADFRPKVGDQLLVTLRRGPFGVSVDRIRRDARADTQLSVGAAVSDKVPLSGLLRLTAARPRR